MEVLFRCGLELPTQPFDPTVQQEQLGEAIKSFALKSIVYEDVTIEVDNFTFVDGTCK